MMPIQTIFLCQPRVQNSNFYDTHIWGACNSVPRAKFATYCLNDETPWPLLWSSFLTFFSGNNSGMRLSLPPRRKLGPWFW